MVENNNLQQINTFVTGMNLDTSDQFLPDSSYREAYNLRLTTDENGNSGVLHNIEGVKLYQNIETHLPVLPEGQSYSNVHVVHTDSIRKYGIILVKATVDSVEYYYIFRFIDKASLIDGETGIPVLIFGPCSTELGENISSVTRYEDADNIKFYFADGIKPIRSINISPSIDSTRPMTDDGSFSIYPTAILSQPEFITLGSGNLKAGAYQYGYQLFTKNGAETEISPLTSLIYTTSSSISPNISSSVRGSDKGSNTGKSIQIKIKINDTKYDRIRIISVFYEETTSVPVIQILGDLTLEKNIDNTVDDIYYQDINNSGISTMTTEEFNSITSVHFVPKLLETKNNFLFASDIHYQDNTFDVDYDARAYSYAYDSSNNLITVLDNNDGTNKIIATRQNILVDKTVTVPTEHDCINPYSVINTNTTSFTDTYTVDMNTNNLRCAYTVHNSDTIWGGEGLNISWRFIVTDLDEVTNGSVSPDGLGHYYGFDGNSTDAVARDFEGVWISNVTKTGSLVNTRFNRLLDTPKKLPCNYSNYIIASRLKTLQRDEVYRYGIVFYNEYNQASPVKWIADIRTPSADKYGFEPFMANRVVSFLETKSDYRRSALTVRPLGIEFEVHNIPSDVTAYEIVRCRRTDSDRSTITQGLIGTTNYPEVQSSGNATFPSQFLTCNGADIQNGNNVGYNDSSSTVINVDSNTSWYPAGNAYYRRKNRGLLTFVSPEVCYTNTTMRNSLPKTGLKLSMVKFVFGNTSSLSLSAREDKIFNGSFVSTGRIRKITKLGIGDTSFNAYLPYFYTDNTIYNRSVSMYEQSNTCGLTNGTNDPLIDFEGSGITGYESDVTDIVYPTETSWKDYQSKLDFIDGAGSFTYTDWVVTAIKIYDGAYLVDGATVQGPHGRSILLKANLPINVTHVGSNPASPMTVTSDRIVSDGNVATSTSNVSLGTHVYYNESVLGTQLCNLRKSVIPYGGYNYTARQFNTYVSVGGFVLNESSNSPTYLFGGDIYINRFVYVNLHYFAGLKTDGTVDTTMEPYVIYDVPVESTINLAYTNGEPLNKYVQIEPANINGKYVQDTPLYVYNSIYSVEPYVRLFTPELLYDEWNKHIDVRTCYSLGKNNDETIDQWTKFQPLNYLDVDTRYGPINNIRTFNNELIFWQANAVGKFSVNERTLINDSTNQPLVLGTGSVLSRYDYVTTISGIKEHHNDTDCSSNNVLYWYDYEKHELCAYSNGEVKLLSKDKYVQSYLNALSKTIDQQSIKPICTFDAYYNEIIATLSNSKSLVYNEKVGAFTGFYSLVPNDRLYFDTFVYFINNNKLYKYNDNVSNNGFGDIPLPISLNYVVNKDYAHTKTYDNIEFSGYVNKDNISIDFRSSGINSKQLTGSSISDRELNYRAAVPRANVEELFANRMRGRALYCTINYTLGNSQNSYIITNDTAEYITTITNSEYIVTNNPLSTGIADNIRFELPYVRTTYRISKS